MRAIRHGDAHGLGVLRLLLLLLLLPVVRLLRGHVLPLLLRLLEEGLPVPLLLLRPRLEVLLQLLPLVVAPWQLAGRLLMPPAAAKLVRLLLIVGVGLLHVLLRVLRVLLLLLMVVLWILLRILLRRSVLRVCMSRRCMLGIGGSSVASG